MNQIVAYIEENPILSQILRFVFSTAAAGLLVFVLLRLTRRIFRDIRKKKLDINTQFGEKIVRFLIIFLAVMWIVLSNDLTRPFGQSLFTSAAVIAAIAGFAAQSVLADLISGIIISVTKPFVVGDRIELDNGIAGIVVDTALRHVVLRGLDTQTYIIPNSKLNGHQVKNMSYQTTTRSVDFRFSVAYATDTEFASRVIRQAIMDSPYSVPGRVYAPGGEKEYAQVYFLAFRDSSLEMGTTAYYEPTVSTEVFKNDINTRVKKALEANHIEIPYQYVNVLVDQRAGE